MKYAFFNAAGRVDSAHNDDTVTALPVGALELSDAQWFSRFDLRLVEGQLIVEPIIKPRTELIAAKWEQIKAKRDQCKAGGVKVKVGGVDKWFHSDEASRIQQMALVMRGASIPANLQWKTLDGSFVTMTQAVAQSVFAAVAASDQAIFTAAEGHRVAMESSADPASYDYSTGWPKIFGE